jgi:hypothetical protein
MIWIRIVILIIHVVPRCLAWALSGLPPTRRSMSSSRLSTIMEEEVLVAFFLQADGTSDHQINTHLSNSTFRFGPNRGTLTMTILFLMIRMWYYHLT